MAPFVREQAESLRLVGVECDFFLLQRFCFRNIIAYFRKIQSYSPDIIHAHYGLSGLFAIIQRKIPVVTTFHGSDLNRKPIYWLSMIACKLSSFSVFVSTELWIRAGRPSGARVVPCGVDINHFFPVDQTMARRQLKLEANGNYLLFAGAFDNPVKNPALAVEVTSQLSDLQLLELKGYSRQEVALLLNAVNVCLLTSHSEGSPQVIKEAMACNCPVLTVNVGSVKTLLDNVSYSCVAAYDVKLLRDRLVELINLNQRSNGRQKIIDSGLDSRSVAFRLKQLYNNLLE